MSKPKISTYNMGKIQRWILEFLEIGKKYTTKEIEKAYNIKHESHSSNRSIYTALDQLQMRKILTSNLENMPVTKPRWGKDKDRSRKQIRIWEMIQI